MESEWKIVFGKLRNLLCGYQTALRFFLPFTALLRLEVLIIPIGYHHRLVI